ncbi:hypothetical protein J8F10_25685 [Gemmata sp. G18]|uniref:Zinc ribbon domain-containing protein n=1 Tax=Gemmata palustris TaxID=2822762 RepID=A0ABS5BYC4_9BACT|nr:hypothetical protein [Gemmata palustris]MBP3958653.1 hypothetical protein [Gemmata palustris]
MTAAVSGPEFVDVLLFIAVAGLFLLFARDWTVRLAGVVLMLPRLLVAPLTLGEVLLFGCTVVAAISRVVYGWSFGPSEPEREAPEAPDVPEPDDVSEPAVCVACRGSIPAGANKCPQCGWSYAAG